VIRYYELIGFAAITHIVILGGGFQKRLGAGLWRRMGKPKAWNFEPLFCGGSLLASRERSAGWKHAESGTVAVLLLLLLLLCVNAMLWAGFAFLLCCPSIAFAAGQKKRPRVRYLGTKRRARTKTVVVIVTRWLEKRWKDGVLVSWSEDQGRTWRLGVGLVATSVVVRWR